MSLFVAAVGSGFKNFEEKAIKKLIFMLERWKLFCKLWSVEGLVAVYKCAYTRVK